MDVGSSGVCAKAPPCYWSPIPPPELRGEPLSDLSTNGGFVSFGMNITQFSRSKKYVILQSILLNMNSLTLYGYILTTC